LERQISITGDGSNSVFSKDLNEHYHSVHGALQESRHVFIDAGLHSAASLFNDLSILEVGLGTGLNALLTLGDPVIAEIKVKYTAIEPFPLSMEIVELLNFTSFKDFAHLHEIFIMMHSCPQGIPLQLAQTFLFTKLEVKMEEVQLCGSEFNLIYFDAFSPQVQPEMWTPEIFFIIFNSMKKGGILVTYSAKGSVKRALKMAGFRVENLPGPPGKREITRAIKD
jgi:tRNA U34 5-methylaminomethyl-2-thiouridine-forming methyltransferase MnmC